MSAAKRLLLLGGGGHARVVADAARLAGWSVAGCLDDDPNAGGADLTRLGPLAELGAALDRLNDAGVHAAVGDPALRRQWMTGTAVMAIIIHPSAVIATTARLGDGVFAGPRCVINPDATIGDGAIVNSGAIVEHDCVIGPFAHVAPGAILTGAVVVGEAALIGAGAIVLPGRRIGAGTVVGAGSIVCEDLPDRVTAVGAPARATGRHETHAH